MISVIISSANPSFLAAISKNIDDTISTEYEIISFDNGDGRKGICEIYNEGVKKAKYEILCFVHEDIEIKTPKWGQVLVSLFKYNKQLGLVGVAGSSYMPLSPSRWGGIGIDADYINISQSFRFQNKEKEIVYRNPNNERLSTVAFVDGVWLSTTKRIALEFKFDELTFKGFHSYDIDFSLSVGTKYIVAVTYDIFINHFSEGKYDKLWLEENLKLNNKWNNSLPRNIEKLTKAEIIKIEKATFKHFVDQLIRFKLPIGLALKVLWNNNRFFNLDKLLFVKIKFHILKRFLAPARVI